MSSNYCVYVHTFPNGKRYVGITCQQLNRRWRNGKAYSFNKRMTNAINRYGWDNIAHDVLYSGLSIGEAERIEQRLIANMNLLDERYGYNYAVGGIHPRHTPQTKIKIGEKSKGRKHSDKFKKWISQKNRGQNNYMYGKHHTEETKKKISNTKKGCTSPNKGKFGSNNPCSKSVVAIDDNGAEVMRFGSIVEAAQYIGKYPSGIQSVLSGKQKTSGGYRWRRS